MNDHHPALICLNGHIITDSLMSELYKANDCCTKCGSKAIFKCPSCNELIRGAKIISFEYDIHLDNAPAYCHGCGKPYPWTLQFLEKCEKNIDKIPKLSHKEKEELKELLPNIVVETPSTQHAFERIKEILVSTSKDARAAIIGFVIEHGCQRLINLLNNWLG